PRGDGANRVRAICWAPSRRLGPRSFWAVEPALSTTNTTVATGCPALSLNSGRANPSTSDATAASANVPGSHRRYDQRSSAATEASMSRLLNRTASGGRRRLLHDRNTSSTGSARNPSNARGVWILTAPLTTSGPRGNPLPRDQPRHTFARTSLPSFVSVPRVHRMPRSDPTHG